MPIRRYLLLVNRINRKDYPSLEDLLDYLEEHDYPVSVRTLRRDMEAVNFDLGMEIEYDYTRRGYFIASTDALNTDKAMHYLQLMDTADTFRQGMEKGRDALKYISFESHGELQGIGYLQPLLDAARNQRVVEMTYQRFQKEELWDLEMEPYLLKEYQGRWYIYGKVKKYNDFRTLGLDRIQQLNVTSQKFKRPAKSNPEEQFAHTIGLTYSLSEVQEVLLQFTAEQGKYVKSLPWHPSQEIVEDSDQHLTIRLIITPNYELNERILAQGDKVKVLEPEWLADQIKELHHSAAGLYKKPE